MAESCPNGKKTLREKVKLLVTSNFSFSHSVFKRLVLQTRKNQGLFGKGLSLAKTYIVLARLALSLYLALSTVTDFSHMVVQILTVPKDYVTF